MTALIFFLLAVAATLSLVWIEQDRQGVDIVNTVKLQRAVDPGRRIVAVANFNLTRTDSSATVTVIDRDGATIRTLQQAAPLSAGPIRFRWGGRDDSAAPADPGRYRLRVQLGDQDRDIIVPGTFVLAALDRRPAASRTQGRR